MPGEREYAKAQAILLGGFATGAALCACLSLTGFVFFLVTILNFDDDRTGRPFWGSAGFLSVALALSLFVASRFGWRVGQDWYRTRWQEQGWFATLKDNK